jgi:hypothetical protein
MEKRRFRPATVPLPWQAPQTIPGKDQAAMTVGNREAFEQRLARIRDTQAAAASPGKRGAAPRRRLPWRAAVLVAVLALGVGVLQQRGALPGVPALLAHLPGTAQPVEAGASGGFLAMVNGLFGGPQADAPPATLPGILPDAPTGWVRLTMAEAADPAALTLLRAAWDALPPEGRPPLDGHPGLDIARQFIADAAGPSAPTRARALYLGADQGVLVLTAILHPAREAFGPPGDKVAWSQALRRQVKVDAQVGDIIESVTLGGISAFNRTRPEGKSTVSRPIGKDHGTATAMRLSAALSHRLEVRITGTATPAAAGLLLSGFDKAGAALLSE